MKNHRGIQFASFILSLAVLVSALAGCTSSKTASDNSDTSKAADDSSKTVVVGVYSGDWEKQINTAALAQFQKDTGIKVQIVPGADAEWITKLKAAKGKNVPYDLLILQPDTIRNAYKADLLQPLDTKDVPNLADSYPSINKNFTFDSKLYAAGFSIGQLGLFYRKDLVKTAPTSWASLWNEEYKGHVAISPLTYSAGLQFFSSQLKNSTPENAFAKLAKLKSSIIAYPDGAGAIQTLLVRGDAWVVPGWDGRAFALAKGGLNVGFVYPTDGAVAAVASWAIPKNSPNQANAYKLLNYILSPKASGNFSELSFYATTNKKTVYSKEFLSKVKVDESYFEKLIWVDYDVATPNLTKWVAEWQKTLG